MRILLCLVVSTAALAASGAAGGSPHVPPPQPATVVPHGYHVVRSYRARLTGGAQADAVVVSRIERGPGRRYDNLQVVSWSEQRRRWVVVFDAQRASAAFSDRPHESNYGAGFPDRPWRSLILNAAADHYDEFGDQIVDAVSFAPLLGLQRDQLVFSFTSVAGGGMHGVIVVVGFDARGAHVLYAWDGDTGLGHWHIARNAIHATANSMAPSDPECCPVRMYAFALAVRNGRITEVADDRPFLGVVDRGDWRSILVDRVIPHTAAVGHLQRGDRIVRINGRGADPRFPNVFLDRLSRLHAGQTVRLLVERRGSRLVETVRLGSLASSEAEAVRVKRGGAL